MRQSSTTENTAVAAVQYRTSEGKFSLSPNLQHKRGMSREGTAPCHFVMKPFYRVCSILITALGRFCCRNKHNDDRISGDPKRKRDAWTPKNDTGGESSYMRDSLSACCRGANWYLDMSHAVPHLNQCKFIYFALMPSLNATTFGFFSSTIKGRSIWVGDVVGEAGSAAKIMTNYVPVQFICHGS